MKKYEYFEHTADVKFKAFGKNLEEAFANASFAMFNVLIENNKVKPKIKKSLSVRGKDLKALLYNFLEELLFLLDSEHFLLGDIGNVKIDRIGKEYVLNTIIQGDKTGKDYAITGDIKAVTYNEMEIKENSEGCTVQVVLDV